MSKSNIEWTEDTWNPIVGCSIVSPGCTHCYAMAMAARIEAMNFDLPPHLRNARQYEGTTKYVNGHAVWTGNLALAPDTVVERPLKRKKPTLYFVNSMGDLFHEDVPFEWIRRVFGVMARCPQHTFQILTKRAARMREVVQRMVDHPMDGVVIKAGGVPDAPVRLRRINADGACVVEPLPNVWLGVSTERQQEADERIPHLLQTPAAVRFISAEPLLGPVDLTSLAVGRDLTWNSLGGHGRQNGLDWVIVGGESGADARPMHPHWARQSRVQCELAGVPFFFKQWGSWARWEPRLPARGVDYFGSDGSHSERPGITREPMVRVHKKLAGRSLDGIEYNGMPSRACTSADSMGVSA